MALTLTLEKFVGRVPDFRQLSDPEKIKLFAWYVHRAIKHDRFATGDIRSCYDTLHLSVPNISECLSRLNARSPRVVLKDGRGFYLEGHVRAAFDADYLSLVEERVVEVDGHLLPDSMIKGTKYIEKLGWEINGCYQYKFYDGCVVLMRRLIESLLIEAFVKAGHVDEIRHANEFVMLDRIIGVAKTKKFISLARGSDKILDDIKYAGDRAAHSRTYVTLETDVKELIPRFRTIVTELMTLADIHATK